MAGAEYADRSPCRDIGLGAAPVERLDERVRTLQAGACEMREERVHDPFAVRSYRAAVERALLGVRQRRGDRARCPGDAAVRGCRDRREERKRVPATEAVI